MKELGRKTERKDEVSEGDVERDDMRERRDRKGDRRRKREYEAGSGRTWGRRREKDYRYSE